MPGLNLEFISKPRNVNRPQAFHHPRRIPEPRETSRASIGILSRRNVCHGRCIGQSQLDVLNIGSHLREQLKSKPCRVYPSDLKLRVEATGLFTYPDLSIVCGEPRLESDHGDVLLNPVVLVEVLSDSTEAYDRGKKFEHYRTIPSLQHYVLITQERHSIDCFTRSNGESWNLTSCKGLSGKITLEAIECELLGSEVYDKVVFMNYE